MFSKSSKGTVNPAESKSVVRSSPPSIISADLKIVGDLSSDGEIQVDGTIDGDIRTNSLLVGETADIKGEIVADSVHVHGTINGQIKSRAVNLAKSAHVVGDVLHEDLAIETGAFLEGHCKRMVNKTEAEERKLNVLGKDDDRKGVGPRAKEAGQSTAESKGSTQDTSGPKTSDPKAAAAS